MANPNLSSDEDFGFDLNTNPAPRQSFDEPLSGDNLDEDSTELMSPTEVAQVPRNIFQTPSSAVKHHFIFDPPTSSAMSSQQSPQHSQDVNLPPPQTPSTVPVTLQPRVLPQMSVPRLPKPITPDTVPRLNAPTITYVDSPQPDLADLTQIPSAQQQYMPQDDYLEIQIPPLEEQHQLLQTESIESQESTLKPPHKHRARSESRVHFDPASKTEDAPKKKRHASSSSHHRSGRRSHRSQKHHKMSPAEQYELIDKSLNRQSFETRDPARDLPPPLEQMPILETTILNPRALKPFAQPPSPNSFTPENVTISGLPHAESTPPAPPASLSSDSTYDSSDSVSSLDPETAPDAYAKQLKTFYRNLMSPKHYAYWSKSCSSLDRTYTNGIAAPASFDPRAKLGPTLIEQLKSLQNPDMTYTCPFCPDQSHLFNYYKYSKPCEIYPNPESLYSHVSLYHYPYLPLLKCQLCSKKLPTKLLMLDHLAEHQTEKAYRNSPLLSKLVYSLENNAYKSFTLATPDMNRNYFPPLFPTLSMPTKSYDKEGNIIYFGPFRMNKRLFKDNILNPLLPQGRAKTAGRIWDSELLSRTVQLTPTLLDAVEVPREPTKALLRVHHQLPYRTTEHQTVHIPKLLCLPIPSAPNIMSPPLNTTAPSFKKRRTNLATSTVTSGSLAVSVSHDSDDDRRRKVTMRPAQVILPGRPQAVTTTTGALLTTMPSSTVSDETLQSQQMDWNREIEDSPEPPFHLSQKQPTRRRNPSDVPADSMYGQWLARQSATSSEDRSDDQTTDNPASTTAQLPSSTLQPEQTFLHGIADTTDPYLKQPRHPSHPEFAHHNIDFTEVGVSPLSVPNIPQAPFFLRHHASDFADRKLQHLHPLPSQEVHPDTFADNIFTMLEDRQSRLDTLLARTSDPLVPTAPVDNYSVQQRSFLLSLIRTISMLSKATDQLILPTLDSTTRLAELQALFTGMTYVDLHPEAQDLKQRLSVAQLNLQSLQTENEQLRTQSKHIRSRFEELRRSTDDTNAYAQLMRERDEYQMRVQQLMDPNKTSSELISLFCGFVYKHLGADELRKIASAIAPAFQRIGINVADLIDGLLKAAPDRS